jgi:hypothetical protein
VEVAFTADLDTDHAEGDLFCGDGDADDGCPDLGGATEVIERMTVVILALAVDKEVCFFEDVHVRTPG